MEVWERRARQLVPAFKAEDETIVHGDSGKSRKGADHQAVKKRLSFVQRWIGNEGAHKTRRSPIAVQCPSNCLGFAGQATCVFHSKKN